MMNDRGSLGDAVNLPCLKNVGTLDRTKYSPMFAQLIPMIGKNHMLAASGIIESWKFGVLPWSASHVLTKVKRPAVRRHSAF